MARAGGSRPFVFSRYPGPSRRQAETAHEILARRFKQLFLGLRTAGRSWASPWPLIAELGLRAAFWLKDRDNRRSPPDPRVVAADPTGRLARPLSRARGDLRSLAALRLLSPAAVSRKDHHHQREGLRADLGAALPAGSGEASRR